jgi:nicotinamide mononucleotide transporter
VSEVLRNIWLGFAEARPLDLLNLVLGVAGVWLMTRRSLLAFPVGLAAVSVQGVLFWQSRFYADAKLQAFFFVCLCYGWWHWTKHKGSAPELPVTRLSWRARAAGVAAATALWLLWGWWQQINTDAAMPFRDTFIASFSFLGQIWQVRKRVENWPVWAAVNAVAVVSYWSGVGAFTAFLYGIFLVLGLIGWVEWAKALRKPAAFVEEPVAKEPVA